jgi:GNAT superfamily N-acetyltransferase
MASFWTSPRTIASAGSDQGPRSASLIGLAHQHAARLARASLVSVMVDEPSFQLETPSPRDADEIARVHVQGWAETYSQLLPTQFYDADTIARREQMWTTLLTDISRLPRLRIARSSSRIVGLALAGPSTGTSSPRALELQILYVLRSHHGTGVGQALLDAVIGIEPAQLWVAEENPRANAFYRRNGFVPDGNRVVDTDANDLVEVRLVR